MKSALLMDQDADLGTVPENYRNKLAYVARKGCKEPVAIYPKGTVFEGEHAVFLVKTGQARPLDDECRKACGLSSDQLATKQISYEMDSLGIHSEKDRKLYIGKVILGYNDDLSYIPGPNWSQYQAAQEQLKQEDEI